MTPRRSTTARPHKAGTKRSAPDTNKRDQTAQATPGFVPLSTLAHGAPDPATAFEEIRSLYFNTTKQTIEADFAHAIALLKSLPSEATREKTTVYMDGLAQMRRDWARKDRT
jgi:hypothetical protein